MERIKVAIEKARERGFETTGRVVPTLKDEVHAEPSANEPVVPADSAVANEPVSVDYRQTVVVPMDAALLERHRVIAHQKSHPASWAFDLLRTQVLQKMDENGWRTLAITSPSVDSGKTVVSINLAMSIAQQLQRTALLVDFDLRRPSVARMLGLNRPKSLNDVFAGNASLGEALVNPGVERLVVLPTNSPVPNASEVLSSAKVGNLVKELRERYSDRVVIFDLPPVLAADDVMTVLPRVDCVLMVVGSGVSTQSEVEEAMSRITRGNLLGVILNKDEAPVRNAYY